MKTRFRKSAYIMLWFSDEINIETAIKNSKILRCVMEELNYNESKSVRQIGKICKCRNIISEILLKMFNEGIVEFIEDKQRKRIYYLTEKGREIYNKTLKNIQYDTNNNSNKALKENEEDNKKSEQDTFKVSVLSEIKNKLEYEKQKEVKR